MERYEVEQLGYRDYGVWDKTKETYVLTGGLDECEDYADDLNEGKAVAANER